MTMLTLSPLAAFFVEKHVESCPSPGCVYNSSVMHNAIDLNNCFIVSYGYSSLSQLPCHDPVVGYCDRRN